LRPGVGWRPRRRTLASSCSARTPAAAGSRSDIDILVIEPVVENEAIASVRLMREVRDLRLPLEVVVVSQRHAEDWRSVRGSLVHAALTEGRVLAG
jgi:alkyl sulfatase BDS1-like metallo-beta-lactamase superfamily hydrolase